MACATLKRSLEFDPVHSHGRPSKRRRCMPMSCASPGTSASSPCNSALSQKSSPFGEIANKLTPGNYTAGYGHFFLSFSVALITFLCVRLFLSLFLLLSLALSHTHTHSSFLASIRFCAHTERKRELRMVAKRGGGERAVERETARRGG